MGSKFSATVPTDPGAHQASCKMGTWSFPGVKSGWGVTPTPHRLLVPWSRKSRAIPLFPLWAVQPVQSLSVCTVQLYLYSPYGPYGLYRTSVPVQYSYTSTPPMYRTACTEPQCLYSTAIPLLPLWTIRSVQSLSACTIQLYLYSPYVPYGLYRHSVPVQYSYTSTPPMDRTACTEPQCLYKGALYIMFLFSLWLRTEYRNCLLLTKTSLTLIALAGYKTIEYEERCTGTT